MKIGMFSFLILLSFNQCQVLGNESKLTVDFQKDAIRLDVKELESIIHIKKRSKGFGHFIQKKHFKIMSKPFMTTGYFAYLNQDLIWKTETPILNAFILKHGESYTVSSTGKIQLQQNSAQFGLMMQDVLQLNLANLDKLFEFYTSSILGCINLLSKNKQINTIFANIEICGDENTTKISLIEKNENLTVVHFTYLKYQDIPSDWLTLLSEDTTEVPEFNLDIYNVKISKQ